MKPLGLKSDLHLHSQFSDGKMSIRELVDLHGHHQFDVISITDHLAEKSQLIGRVTRSLNLSLCEKKFESYRKEVQKEKIRALELYNLNLIFGYEITKNSFENSRSCHLLILGVESYISPDLPVEKIILQAKRQGGLVIAAHPFPTGEFEFQSFYLWSRREQFKDLIDAWEVSIRKKISTEVLNSGLPLIASSDFHHLKHFNSWKTRIFAENNLEAIKKALTMKRVDFFVDSLDEAYSKNVTLPLETSYLAPTTFSLPSLTKA
jgi:hypothetical protein